MSQFEKHLYRCGLDYRPLYSIREAAWLLHRTSQSVRNYLADGTLHGLRVGYRWGGVFAESLARLIEKGVH